LHFWFIKTIHMIGHFHINQLIDKNFLRILSNQLWILDSKLQKITWCSLCSSGQKHRPTVEVGLQVGWSEWPVPCQRSRFWCIDFWDKYFAFWRYTWVKSEHEVYCLFRKISSLSAHAIKFEPFNSCRIFGTNSWFMMDLYSRIKIYSWSCLAVVGTWLECSFSEKKLGEVRSLRSWSGGVLLIIVRW